MALLFESVARVNEAIEFFERARDINPEHPLPWIGLADAFGRMAFTFDPEGGWDERAREMNDRALQLDPDVPDGRYIRGRLAWTPKSGFPHEYAMKEIAAALMQPRARSRRWPRNSRAAPRSFRASAQSPGGLP